ncbi:MAG TPA: pyridoxal-phosphate dependent enzyme [Allosphingosinicella sp.]|jgi:threonine dehydratase|nr:pyridoxal-phosphate dependent enzyme [Allosphingosinicella sp.]
MAQGPDLEAPLSEAEIAAARSRIAGAALRTPLVPRLDGSAWLKLECLQPTGSYKIRGATNALKARREAGEPLKAIVTASAGNFGQAIARAAASLGLPCVIHVPDNAARVKVENLKRMGAEVREHDFADWWRIMQTRETGDEGAFFHPVCEREVIAGAATVGAEIVEDLPEVEAVLIPIGGGGLASGIAQAVKARRPQCRIYAVETDTALPLKAAVAAGAPVTVERTASFVDGMGSTRVLDPMWPLLRRLIDDVIVVTLAEVEAAIRTLAAEHHVVAEGAGAAALAAAAQLPPGNKVAIVSGGNLDWAELRRILAVNAA